MPKLPVCQKWRAGAAVPKLPVRQKWRAGAAVAVGLSGHLLDSSELGLMWSQQCLVTSILPGGTLVYITLSSGKVNLELSGIHSSVSPQPPPPSFCA